MALSAIIQVYGEGYNNVCLKRFNKGTPVEVTGEIYSIAKELVDTEVGLTSETLTEALLTEWIKMENPPKDLTLACDYLFEAKVRNNRLSFREKRQD